MPSPGLILVTGLKFHPHLRAWWVNLALLCLAAAEILQLSHPTAPWPLGSSLIALLSALAFWLSWRPMRRPWPGHRPQLRLGYQGLGILWLACAMLGKASPPALELGALALLAGMLLQQERALLAWRNLGLVQIPHPFWAWILAGAAWFSLGLPGLGIVLLFKVRPGTCPTTLTPCQATLLLRLPLATVNACLDRIPPKLQLAWFRPDPWRLHLKEPLLEAKNAPGYFTALAARLNDKFHLKGFESILEEGQLARFCQDYPDSTAETLLELELDKPPEAAPGFTSDNLTQRIKPGRWEQLGHLLRLRRIKAKG